MRYRWSVVTLLAIFGLLLALITPGLLAVREAVRRMRCGLNLTNLGFAIQNYHDTHSVYPMGACGGGEGKSSAPNWGPSWVYALLPYTNSQPLYNRLEKARTASPHQSLAHHSVWNAAAGDTSEPWFFYCYSSAYPRLEMRRPLAGGDPVRLFNVSYVAISGAWGDIPETANNPSNGFTETRGAAAGPNGGVLSGGGMILLNDALTFADCRDGTGYQIVFAEMADYYRDSAGVRHRLDPAGNLGAWFLGTDTSFRFPQRDEVAEASAPIGQVYNLATIRHPLAERGRNTIASGSGNTGIHEERGVNNPLTSAHSQGILICFLDGHVQSFGRETDLLTLKRYATRDDGGKVE